MFLMAALPGLVHLVADTIVGGKGVQSCPVHNCPSGIWSHRLRLGRGGNEACCASVKHAKSVKDG